MAYASTASAMAGMRFSPVRAASFHRRQRSRGLLRVAARAQRRQAFGLLALDCRVHAQRRNGDFPLRAIAIHAHDHALALLDGTLVFVRRSLNLALHVSGFDGPQHAAQGINLLDGLARQILDLAGQLLDRECTAHRVHRICHARFVRQNLLRAQRQQRRSLRRQRQRLIEGIGVQRLAAAQHRRQRLHGDAHQVVVRLLRRQRRAGRLRVKAQHHRTRIARAEIDRA